MLSSNTSVMTRSACVRDCPQYIVARQPRLGDKRHINGDFAIFDWGFVADYRFGIVDSLGDSGPLNPQSKIANHQRINIKGRRIIIDIRMRVRLKPDTTTV